MAKQFKLFGGTIHNALVHAVTEYDRKQSTKRYYNPYALGQMLMRLDEVEADIAKGTAPRQALIAAFNDRLLDHLLKAIGETKFTREEVRFSDFVYRPVSAEGSR